MKWSIIAPNKPGTYWFYGEWRGSMGCHFFEDSPPIEPKFYLVEIINVSNGIMAITNGRFETLKLFNKNIQREGYIGYWSRATLPNVPYDINKYFEPRS